MWHKIDLVISQERRRVHSGHFSLNRRICFRRAVSIDLRGGGHRRLNNQKNFNPAVKPEKKGEDRQKRHASQGKNLKGARGRGVEVGGGLNLQTWKSEPGGGRATSTCYRTVLVKSWLRRTRSKRERSADGLGRPSERTRPWKKHFGSSPDSVEEKHTGK